MLHMPYIYKHSGFPPASKFLEKQWQKEAHTRHRRTLKNMKPHLDIKPPQEFLHLRMQMKKIQMEHERQAAIDRENRSILNKLVDIKQTHGRVDNWNRSWQPRRHRTNWTRQREMERIDRENKKQAQRLNKVESYYHTEEWEKDFKKHLYYQSIIESTTKDYDEPSGSKRDSEEYSDAEDFESDNETVSPRDKKNDNEKENKEKEKKGKEKEKNKDKEKPGSDSEEELRLPPIKDENKGDKSKGKKTDTYSEQGAIMDAEELHSAIEDDDKNKILEILARTSDREKLQKLCGKYKEIYNKDLMDDIKPKLDEDAQEVLTSLADSSKAADDDAELLYEATKGLGTDEDALIEILCTRTNSELAAIKEAYLRKYGHSLEEDLKGDTSGDVEKLLVQLSKGTRDESKKADKKLAQKDAVALIEAGPKSWGTDEGQFIRIFTQRSHAQLSATFPEYKKLAKTGIEESIDSEMDGDLQKAFLTIVKCVKDPASLQGGKLHEALESGDTKTVAKIILSKTKAQLSDLSSAYKKACKVNLVDAVEKKCSGDLKALLLTKLGKGQDQQKQKGKGKTQDKEKSKSKEDGVKLPPIHKKEQEKKAVKDSKKDAKPKEEKKNVKKEEKKAENDKSKASNAKEKTKNRKGNQKGKEKENEKEKEYTDKDAEKDSDELHQASTDSNKDKIVEILVKNCAEKSRLNKLSEKYKKKYAKDLLEDINPIMEAGVQEALDAILAPSAEFDAKCLNDAIKGLGTDEDTLIDILSTRTNTDLSEIMKVYEKEYGQTLENDIKGDTSGDFEKLLVELSKGSRSEATKVDNELAKKDAESLYQAGAKSWGTDEDKFIEIFTKRSIPQLNAMYGEYTKLASVEIEESIEAEMTGDMEKGLLALIKYSRDPAKLKSDKIVRAVQNEDFIALAKIVFTSNKAKLADVLAVYKKTSKKNLEDDIEKKMEGDLQILVLAKLGKKKKAQDQGKETQKKDTKAGKSVKKDPKADLNKNKKGEQPSGKQPDEKKKPATGKKEEDKDDCEQLNEAIKAGDKKKVTEVLIRNGTDSAKLQKLAQEYQNRFKKNMLEDVQPSVEEDVHQALTAVALPSDEYDTVCLHQAMKGLGTDEALLIEILCTKSNSELTAIKKTYSKKYDKPLEEDVKSETGGDFENLLVKLLEGKRDESTNVSQDAAKEDAEALVKAGIKKWGTDEDKFIEVFTQRSLPHLKAMLPEYQKLASSEIEDSIRSEMDGSLQDGLLALVASVRNPSKLFAEKLDKALSGGDTNTVARIVLGTKEKELLEIEKAYNASYKPDLATELSKKCNEDMKKLLTPRLTGQDQQKHKGKGKIQSKAKGKSKKDGVKLPPIHKIEQEKKTTKDSKKDANSKNEDENKQKYTDKDPEKGGDELHKAITNSNKDKIVEILAKNCAEKSRLNKLCEKYKNKYAKDLLDEIKPIMEAGVQEALDAMLAPSAEFDAKCLNDAIKGLGTDEDTLIDILSTRTNTDLSEVKKVYEKKYSQTLENDIKGDTSGDFEKLLVELSKGSRSEATKVDKELAKKDAESLYQAGAKSWGTDEDKFIEVFTKRSIPQLNVMYGEYKELANIEIEESIETEMTGDMENGLMALVRYSRDPAKLKSDKIVRAVQNGDYIALAKMVFTSNKANLAEALAAYKRANKNSLEDKIKTKMEGDLQILVLAKLGKQKEPQDKEKKTEKNKDPSARKSVKKEPKADQNKNKKGEQLNTKQTNKKGKPVKDKKEGGKDDCQRLNAAVKAGDKKKVTEVLIRNGTDSAKFQNLAQEYQNRFKKNMLEDVQPRVEKDIHQALTAIALPSDEYDTVCLHQAMKGLGTDEVLLIEILCTKSNSEIAAIKKKYSEKYDQALEKDVKSETGGDFENLLVKLLEGKRDESTNVSQDTAKEDAEALVKAGIKKWGTDEDKFIEVFTQRSLPHLKAMLPEYQKLTNSEIEDSIRSEMDGSLQVGLLALVASLRDPSKLFAEKLNKALSGGDTNTVARLVLGTKENELLEIEKTYNASYKPDLATELSKTKCNEDMKKLLTPRLTGSKHAQPQ